MLRPGRWHNPEDQEGASATPARQPERLHIEITGAVQGVGFRPFVYRLAREEELSGWVLNDVGGVVIEVEGPADRIQSFHGRLTTELPPLASIETIASEHRQPRGEMVFTIRASEGLGEKTAVVLPDVATCADCTREVANPGDRRYRYPFTNCTNCGPRFSIITDLPYDRPNTTMTRFVMCDHCQAEYDDPGNRRFHAQPNACPACGPRLAAYVREGGEWMETATGHQAMKVAAEALRGGSIVAAKGLGGFHLMTDAADENAVQTLRDRKPRPHKPLALMVLDLEQAREIAEIGDTEAAMLASTEAPIVLLTRRPGAAVADGVAPGNPTIGVMRAYTPLHRLLLEEVGGPIVATSGNLTDEPIATDENHAVGYLGHIADVFLVHDRPIERHVDDSVTWVVDGRPQLLRRARGYAPSPAIRADSGPTTLAVGAHLKNTVALASGRRIFVSQHIGDLETPEALGAFERVIEDFLRMYEAEPEIVAHDLHPDYLSTRWAKQSEWGDRLVAVQHHHAHLAACLADNSHEGPALGVTWDGTGYGPDGTIWGGEFLAGDVRTVERVAHLRPFRLPGGDSAVKEPRRVGLGLLWEIYGEKTLSMKAPPVTAMTDEERRLMVRMLANDLNSPVTTSAGRLFDGVASLVGLRQQVTFEAHAAMDLEFITDATEGGAYPIPLISGNDGALILDWEPMIGSIIDDTESGTGPGVIAARFHNGLIGAIVAVAETTGMETVALTGGCFQNRLLTQGASAALTRAGFEVLIHGDVPPNDGGISLGQAVVAAARWADL